MGILRTDKISGLEKPTAVTGSVVFDGDGDYLDVGASSDFAFGTGDFTIEGWVNISSFALNNNRNPRIYMTDGPTDNASGNLQVLVHQTAGALYLYSNSSDLNLVTNGILTRNEWNHFAVCRSGTTLKSYVNGVESSSSTYSTSITANSGNPRPRIGSIDADAGELTGYISNLRVCKGHAVYTSNFAVPTRELDVHPGPEHDRTVLLCCYDGENIFADKSGRHIISAYGDRTSSPTPTATDSPIGITTFQPGLDRDVDNTFGPSFQGGAGYNSQNWLTLPKGTTTDRNRIGGRGLFGGSGDSTFSNAIQFVTISSTGNSQDFGDLTEARSRASSYGSTTRGVWAGGNPVTNTIDYVTIATTGNAVAFGELTVARRFLAGTSSSTRGISAGGNVAGGSPHASNSRIDFTTIATLGDAQTFGELAAAKSGLAALSSPTRALFAGGYTSGVPAAATVNITQVEISTLGDSTNFGDLTVTRGGGFGSSGSHGGLQ